MLLLFSLMGFGQLRSLRSPSWSIEAAILLDGRSLLLHGVAVVGAVSMGTALRERAPRAGRAPEAKNARTASGAFIIASTACSCVGIGDQHSGIVRLFEVV